MNISVYRSAAAVRYSSSFIGVLDTIAAPAPVPTASCAVQISGQKCMGFRPGPCYGRLDMNPYAKYLGTQDPLDVLASTADKLKALSGVIGPSRATQSPASGKWSARDIFCHLADTELAFAFRLRQSLAEAHHMIQPMDQEKWAKVYPAMDGAAALSAFLAIRAWNLLLLHAVPRATHAKSLFHPERGAITFGSLLETMAGHDLNHIVQLEAIAGQTEFPQASGSGNA